LDHILENIVNQGLNFWHEVHQYFGCMWLKCQLLKPGRENGIVKITRWYVWSRKALESKACIPNVMQPNKKIEE